MQMKDESLGKGRHGGIHNLVMCFRAVLRWQFHRAVTKTIENTHTTECLSTCLAPNKA